jgi:hypothetical protein
MTQDEFFDKVAPCPMSGCWIWMKYVRKTPSPNYFQPWMGYNGKSQSAVRVAWQLFKGEIPKDAHVLHTCDNCYCVNPEHLYLGDHTSNMLDMNHRGRGKTANQKMNGEDVLEAKRLRSTGMRVVDIAKQFGVTAKGLSRILNGGRWSQYQGRGVAS